MTTSYANNAHENPPIVLSFSTLDPSGAGGIQADIETAASLGCHCTPIVTSICASGDMPQAEIFATEPTLIIEQARSIIDEMNVCAFKIGFLGSRANAEAIHSILLDNAELPAVSHPEISLFDTANPDHRDLLHAYTNLILPLSNLTILSLEEARKIAMEADTIETTAHAILSSGCETVLLTDTGKNELIYQNSAFNTKGLIKNYSWEQGIAICHGSRSTLATSVASYFAHGFSDQQSLEPAQNYTWQSMRAARNLGFRKPIPHRLFWADKNLDNTSTTITPRKTH